MIKKTIKPNIKGLYIPFFKYIFILISFPALSVAQQQMENYILTGPKATLFDTLAYQTVQKVAKESIGIFEKEIIPDKYILGPNDELIIGIIGPKSKELNLKVSPEGKIFINEVGVIQLKDKSLAEAENIIKEKVKKCYKADEVYVYLKEVRKLKVSVSGAVIKSLVVPATAVDRVSEIIDRAGGTRTKASSRKITLLRNEGKTVIKVDLWRYFMLGNQDANPTVLGGDHIIIPMTNEQECIEISGEIPAPGKYEYVPGDSLSTLIKFAQGFFYSSFLDSVEIVRFSESGNTVNRWFINIESWRNKISTGEPLQGDFPLVVGDRIYIRKIPDWQKDENIVITGEVNFPGHFAIEEGKTKVSDLIDRAGGFKSNASLDATFLIRRSEEKKVDKEMERLSRIPSSEMSKNEYRYYQSRITERRGTMAINFNKIIKDKNSEDNILLMNEDSIIVPFQKYFINVQGRVNSPGMVVYNVNYTYMDYINLAGGFGYRADESSTFVVKAKGEQFLAKSMNYTLEPGDNILVPPETETTFFEVFTTALTITTQLVTIAGVVLAIMNFSK